VVVTSMICLIYNENRQVKILCPGFPLRQKLPRSPPGRKLLLNEWRRMENRELHTPQKTMYKKTQTSGERNDDFKSYSIDLVLLTQ